MILQLKWVDREDAVQTATFTGYDAASLARELATGMINMGVCNCVQIKELDDDGNATGNNTHIE